MQSVQSCLLTVHWSEESQVGEAEWGVCECLQVEPTSPPALVPPSPSIIHGGCQTSRTRPQHFQPDLENLGWICCSWKNLPDLSGVSLLWVLVEYSRVKYGSSESDGLLHIFGWFPNWWKVQLQRVWEGWVVWARGWREAAAWFMRWFLASDATLYTLSYTVQCVWEEKVEYLQSWQHTTLTLDHSLVQCEFPTSWLVFGKAWICQYKKEGSNTHIWEIFPSAEEVPTISQLAKRDCWWHIGTPHFSFKLAMMLSVYKLCLTVAPYHAHFATLNLQCALQSQACNDVEGIVLKWEAEWSSLRYCLSVLKAFFHVFSAMFYINDRMGHYYVGPAWCSVCVCLQRTVLCYWQTATLHHCTTTGLLVGKAKHRRVNTGQGIGWNRTQGRVWDTVIKHMMTFAYR